MGGGWLWLDHPAVSARVHVGAGLVAGPQARVRVTGGVGLDERTWLADRRHDLVLGDVEGAWLFGRADAWQMGPYYRRGAFEADGSRGEFYAAGGLRAAVRWKGRRCDFALGVEDNGHVSAFELAARVVLPSGLYAGAELGMFRAGVQVRWEIRVGAG